MLAAQAASDVAAVPSYGASLLQTLAALVAVCVLAYVVLRHGLARAYGAGRGGGAMRIVERLPLDARRSLVLVAVGERLYLVGTGDGAAPSLLGEVPKDAVPEAPAPEPRKRFRDLIDPPR